MVCLVYYCTWQQHHQSTNTQLKSCCVFRVPIWWFQRVKMEPNFLSRAVSPTAFFKLTDPSNFKLLRPSVWPLWHLPWCEMHMGKNFFWRHRISRTQDLSLACREISDCNGCWFILCQYKPSFNTLLFLLEKTEVISCHFLCRFRAIFKAVCEYYLYKYA